MSDQALVILTVVETVQSIALVAILFGFGRGGGAGDAGLVAALSGLIKGSKD